MKRLLANVSALGAAALLVVVLPASAQAADGCSATPTPAPDLLL